MIKVQKNLGMQGTYLRITKTIHNNPTVNITLNGKKISKQEFTLKSGTRQGCPISPFLFNIMFKVFTRAIRQVKEIKGL